MSKRDLEKNLFDFIIQFSIWYPRSKIKGFWRSLDWQEPGWYHLESFVDRCEDKKSMAEHVALQERSILKCCRDRKKEVCFYLVEILVIIIAIIFMSSNMELIWKLIFAAIAPVTVGNVNNMVLALGHILLVDCLTAFFISSPFFGAFLIWIDLSKMLRAFYRLEELQKYSEIAHSLAAIFESRLILPKRDRSPVVSLF